MIAVPTVAPNLRLTRATGRRPELGPDGALVMRCGTGCPCRGGRGIPTCAPGIGMDFKSRIKPFQICEQRCPSVRRNPVELTRRLHTISDVIDHASKLVVASVYVRYADLVNGAVTRPWDILRERVDQMLLDVDAVADTCEPTRRLDRAVDRLKRSCNVWRKAYKDYRLTLYMAPDFLTTLLGRDPASVVRSFL